MVDKVDIDYCAVGKARSFFGRMKGELVETHSMSCLGKDRCNSCKYQFCADVTYRGQTITLEERTATDFIDEVKRKIRIDLRPYVKGLRN